MLFPVTARVVGPDHNKYAILIAYLVTVHEHNGQKLWSSHFKDKIWKEKKLVAINQCAVIQAHVAYVQCTPVFIALLLLWFICVLTKRQ